MDKTLLSDHFLQHAELTSEELDTICASYFPKFIGKGDFLLRRGEVARVEGFVVSGCFRVFTTDGEGAETNLYFAAEDWWLMDIDSFIHQTPSKLGFQAIEDSAVLIINKPDKERLYQIAPKVEHLFRVMYQKAVVAWQDRVIRNHTMNAEQRYHHFVSNYPEIAKKVTNRHIASYLGITHEFVSVIRKRRLERNI